MIETLSKVLPQIAIIAAVCGIIGWSLRGLTIKPAAAKPAPTSDKGQQDRAKNLETALEKSKAAHKSVKAELETLQSASVSKATFESKAAEVDAARKALDTETKRISTLEADLKKSQDTIRTLNSRANDADKAQKDRNFAVENELSKTREQLAILQNRPDDSAVLQAEIERLRESVAVSTRYAGEMRKREAVAVEALEKAEGRIADLSDAARPAAVSKKIGPVVDSGRIAAAKAEVLRLVEQNKQKAAVLTAAIGGQAASEIAPSAAASEFSDELAISPVAPETFPVVPEIVPVAPEVVPVAPEIVPVAPDVVPVAPEIVPDAPDVVPAAPEVVPVAPDVIPVAPDVIPVAPDVIPAAPDGEFSATEENPTAAEEIELAPEHDLPVSSGSAADQPSRSAEKKAPATGELFAMD